MCIYLQEALKVMKGVARGLHTLHSANIIHGSLHQNNVFALNREQGIVGDFDFTKSEVKYHGFIDRNSLLKHLHTRAD